MTAVANANFETSIPSSRRGVQLAGLGLVMAVPALFWTTVVALAAPAAGISVSATGLMMTATCIALFLGAVCAPIVLKANTAKP